MTRISELIYVYDEGRVRHKETYLSKIIKCRGQDKRKRRWEPKTDRGGETKGIRRNTQFILHVNNCTRSAIYANKQT